MFATDSFINAEVTYRGERIRKDWGDGSTRRARPQRPRRSMTEQRHDVGGARHNGRRAHRPQRRPRRTRCRAGGPDLPARHSRVRAGPTPHAVLLAGDAGVGKTRLLTELRDVALGEGWLVLAGHCLDLADGSLPYLPFSEILGRILAERPEVAASVTDRHPTLARLQPGRRLRATDDRDEDQSLDRGNIFAAVHDLLETVAEEGPLLVVVEDAHWADQSTRDMLSFLFSRPFAGPVRLVVSYRSDDLHRRHPLRPQVAEWARLRGRRARCRSSRSATPTCVSSST